MHVMHFAAMVPAIYAYDVVYNVAYRVNDSSGVFFGLSRMHRRRIVSVSIYAFQVKWLNRYPLVYEYSLALYAEARLAPFERLARVPSFRDTRDSRDFSR